MLHIGWINSRIYCLNQEFSIAWRVGFLLSTNLKFNVLVHIQSNILERHNRRWTVVSEENEISIGVCELQSDLESGSGHPAGKPKADAHNSISLCICCSMLWINRKLLWLSMSGFRDGLTAMNMGANTEYHHSKFIHCLHPSFYSSPSLNCSRFL